METVSIYTFQNVIEESRIRAALEAEGIEVMILSFEDSAYNGIYTLQKGRGQIRVLEKDVENAKKIVEECCSRTKVDEGSEGEK